MIQANELRIGNYVNCTYIVEEHNEEKDEWIDIPYTVIGKVTAIDSVNLTDHKIWVETTDYIEEFEKIEPIPLTEDILLRCGFKMDSYNRISSNSPIMFMRQPNDNVICFAHNCTHKHIKNLHQLQNLFYSLTGEELILQP